MRIEFEFLAVVVQLNALPAQAAAIDKNLFAGGIQKRLAMAANLAGVPEAAGGVLLRRTPRGLAAELIVKLQHLPHQLPDFDDRPNLQYKKRGKEKQQKVILPMCRHRPTRVR